MAVRAVVLTFNAPDNARACVAAIAAQTVPVESVLVIENPGGEPLGTIAANIPVKVVTASENLGPAGGFALGLSMADGHDVWAMDDDIIPAPDCLARLLDAEPRSLRFPALTDAATGEPVAGWGWWGVLIPGDAIRTVGLPNARLWYGSEDQDYLIDRCGTAGYPLNSVAAAHATIARRPGGKRPAWHYYYLPRNTVYQTLHARKHMPPMMRLKVCVASVLGLAQHDPSWRHSWMIVRGVVDGVACRMGRRVDPGTGARPVIR